MQELARITSKNAADTERFARELAMQLKAGDCVALTGDLGTGKTTFVRGVVKALAGEVEVVSPSFMLAQSYDITLGDGKNATLWHYDLYRIKTERELAELGMEDALANNVVFIEWPAILGNQLPAHHLAVCIEYGAGADERMFVLEGDEAWRARLTTLRSAA